jgi:hypothetical protein
VKTYEVGIVKERQSTATKYIHSVDSESRLRVTDRGESEMSETEINLDTEIIDPCSGSYCKEFII